MLRPPPSLMSGLGSYHLRTDNPDIDEPIGEVVHALCRSNFMYEGHCHRASGWFPEVSVKFEL